MEPQRIANLTIPSGLRPEFFTIFFLLNCIFEGLTFFLVYHDGRFHWIMMDLEFLEIVQRLRDGVPFEHIDWNRSCERISSIVTEIPFDLGDRIIQVPLNNLVLPRRRNVKIRLVSGQIVLAKYLEYYGLMSCESTNRNEDSFVFLVQGTEERVIIPIGNIMTHTTTRDEVESYNKNLERKKQLEKAKAEAKAALEASEDFKKQMRQKGEIVDKSKPQRNYPFLSDHLLQILYHLSVRCNVKIGFKYRFNLLVFRLLSFGYQTHFQLPQLSEEEQVNFEAFKTKYNNEMVGRVIRSRKARFQAPSGILEGLKRLFEYYLHLFDFDEISDEDVREFLQRSEKTNAQLAESMVTCVEALSLPVSYWVQPEHGVEVRKLKSKFPMFHHLLTDREVFDNLVQ
jgi:hypothetical protein